MNVARIKIAFAGLAVVITGLWLLSLSEATLTGGFWPLRNALVYLTGFLAIGFMSAAVILAARPTQIEGLLGGLDKFYWTCFEKDTAGERVGAIEAGSAFML